MRGDEASSLATDPLDLVKATLSFNLSARKGALLLCRKRHLVLWQQVSIRLYNELTEVMQF